MPTPCWPSEGPGLPCHPRDPPPLISSATLHVMCSVTRAGDGGGALVPISVSKERAVQRGDQMQPDTKMSCETQLPSQPQRSPRLTSPRARGCLGGHSLRIRGMSPPLHGRCRWQQDGVTDSPSSDTQERKNIHENQVPQLSSSCHHAGKAPGKCRRLLTPPLTWELFRGKTLRRTVLTVRAGGCAGGGHGRQKSSCTL